MAYPKAKLKSNGDKVMVIKHPLVSNYSEWGMHHKNVYVHRLHCRFYLNTL